MQILEQILFKKECKREVKRFLRYKDDVKSTSVFRLFIFYHSPGRFSRRQIDNIFLIFFPDKRLCVKGYSLRRKHISKFLMKFLTLIQGVEFINPF